MEQLFKELKKSAYLHKPLPLHREHSLEAEIALKDVLARRTVHTENPDTLGPCTVSAWTDADGTRFMRLEAASNTDTRPHGDLEKGDCSNLGQVCVRIKVAAEDWTGFNRLYFRVHPQCEGLRKPHLGMQFYNEGKNPVPDRYHREGFHTINLVNDQWNDCYVEFPTLPRDRITAVEFVLSLNGCETQAELGNRLSFDIGEIELQCASETQPDAGWALSEGKIAWCFSGYEVRLEKRAVIGADAPCAFELINERGESVYKGIAQKTAYPHILLADFTAFCEPGKYLLRTAHSQTDPFEIGEDIWQSSAWKVLNFLFCERCGYPVPGIHQSCHRDILARHAGKSFVFNGGWHDAGDLSQQLIQTAEVTQSLFEMYSCLHVREPEAAQRFLEEALWGLDYILKSRFGDGYRATSVGMSMWTQGFIGDRDDVNARVHNNAYENYLCAGVEAYAAQCLKKEDSGLALRALNCAEADFAFAEAKFGVTGFDERPLSFWEHSYMTPESVFSATMAWSAALLYKLTGLEKYARCAGIYSQSTLECMETGNVCAAFENGGFFWRNREKRVPVHFNHQAREQIFSLMFMELIGALPGHPDAEKWQRAARKYAGYLRRLYDFSSPYGMLPAGIYHVNETEDNDSFFRQHLLVGEEAKDAYALQLKQGVDLGGGWFLKQFPVWFSFRGNNAVLLSQAKAAAVLGNLLKDGKLKSIASAQLKWNAGLNPFRQSLMYGEGQRYASQYAVLPGEMTGELPVGVQTKDDSDEPYWPQMNNATYKEVWTTPAGRWLSVAAELMGEA